MTSNPEWKATATRHDRRGQRAIRYSRELRGARLGVFLDEATDRWFHNLCGTACTAGPFATPAEAQNSAERHAMDTMLLDLETLTGRRFAAQHKDM